ncbi:MAG: hypothetical protein WDN23_12375 [Edaphobacter sp.]
MTWHSFFDFSTMGHRHIVFVYAGVWIAQGAYLAWIAWNWAHIKGIRR